MGFAGFCGFCVGASHIEKGLGCEDYAAYYGADTGSVIAVSDGHGDKNCFRSALGARLACEIAVRELADFIRISPPYYDSAELERGSGGLEQRISRLWLESVTAHSRDYPFTEKELSALDMPRRQKYIEGAAPERAYGCTLIAAAVTDEWWLALQIGDGVCVAAYEGGAYVAPVPPDENCVGNHSTSLCDEHAASLFRHYHSDIIPDAVFAVSDGVEESFDGAGLNLMLSRLAQWARESGAEAARSRLMELLPKISAGGSGDDASAAALVDLDAACSDPLPMLDAVYEREDKTDAELVSITAELKTAKSGLERENAAAAEADEKIAALERELELLRERRGEISEKAGHLEQRVLTLEKQLEQSRELAERTRIYREKAEKFWFARYDTLNIEFQPPKR